MSFNESQLTIGRVPSDRGLEILSRLSRVLGDSLLDALAGTGDLEVAGVRALTGALGQSELGPLVSECCDFALYGGRPLNGPLRDALDLGPYESIAIAGKVLVTNGFFSRDRIFAAVRLGLPAELAERLTTQVAQAWGPGGPTQTG